MHNNRHNDSSGKKPTEQEIRNKAIGMLARRSLTVKELKDRLRKKGADSVIALKVTSEMVEKGYIDEGAIIDDAIRIGKDYKPKGRFRLRQELKNRGIGSEDIEAKLDEEYPDIDEFQVAMKFAERKQAAMTDLPNETRYRRLAGSLNRLGFSSDVIQKVLADLGIEPF